MGAPLEVAMQRLHAGTVERETGEHKRSFSQRAKGHLVKYFHAKSPKDLKESNPPQSPAQHNSSGAARFGPKPGTHHQNKASKGSSPRTPSSVNGHHSGEHLRASRDDYPDEFKCPISNVLMAEPVIVTSGISYERSVIELYLRQGYRQCFKSGATLDSDAVFKNTGLKTAIESWCDANGVSRPVPPSAQAARDAVDRACRAGSSTSESFGTDDPSPSNSSGEWPRPHHSGTSFSGNDFRGQEIHEDSPLNVANLPNEVHSVPSPGKNRQFEARHTWSEGHLRQSLDSKASSRHSSGRHDVLEGDDRPSPTSTSNHAHTVSIPTPPRQSSAEAVEHSRGAVPLTLATRPVSFGPEDRDRAASPGSSGDMDDETINRLISKLKHKHAMEQEEAAVEIRRLTRISAQNRLILCQTDVLEAILPLLQSRYSQVQINAVASIMNLSLEKENKLKVARVGAIPILIDVLKNGVIEAQEHAAGAIFSLALNDENKMAIGVLGAIPPLIHLLRSNQQGARRDAAMALYHLSFSQMNRSKLIRAGGVGTFLAIAKEEKSDVVSRALLILCNIAAMQEGRAALAEKDAVPILVGLLSSGDADEDNVGDQKVNWAEVREHAAAALLQLSQHNFRFKSQASQAGALDALQRLEVEGTPRGREKAAALLSILRDTQDGSDHGALYPRRSYVRQSGGPDRAESAIF